MCTAINGIVTDEQVRMDSAENRAEVHTRHKGHYASDFRPGTGLD